MQKVFEFSIFKTSSRNTQKVIKLLLALMVNYFLFGLIYFYLEERVFLPALNIPLAIIFLGLSLEEAINL